MSISTRTSSWAFSAFILFSLAVFPLRAADWPQWRGPDQNLIAPDTDVWGDGDFGLEVRWRRSLGSGYSAVSVVGKQAVTAFSDGSQDIVVALDVATGAEIWRTVLGPTFRTDRGSEPGPAGTPTLHAGLVYMLSPAGRLLALALTDGSEVWSRDLLAEDGARPPAFGFSSAPLLADGVLVVQTGGPAAAVSGFEPATGRRLWTAGKDTVGQQSPLRWKPGVVLAVTDHFLLGIAVASGQLLWQHPIEMQEIGWSQPVRVGDDKVLLFDGARAVLYLIAQNNTVEQVWESAVVRPNYVTPIPIEGALVGFRGNFLTAIDATTGEELWQSRAPGLSGLILVDGHLVSLGARGDLVVGKASREGFLEVARLPVSERASLVPPTFADGSIFVRNRTEVVRIDLGRSVPPDRPEVPLLGAFAKAVAAVEAIPKLADRQAAVDRLLAEQKSFPILEGDSLAHLVYRGEVTDIAVLGNFPGDGHEERLRRVAGTDLYVRSYALPPGSHWEYRFNIDHGEYVPDPLHSDRIGPEGRQRSRLRMPGWQEPEHLKSSTERPRGRIETVTLHSKIFGEEREMRVYLPPGYDHGKKRYPVLLVQNGDLALEIGKMNHSLDNLVGRKVAPLIAVFLPQVSAQEYAGRATENYVRMLAEELVPWLDARYRTVAQREARGLLGTASGGYVSAYGALRYPEVFSRVASQSFISRGYAHEPLLQLVRASERLPVTFYLEWSRNDYRQGVWGFDARVEALRFVSALTAKGYAPHTVEVEDGAGWGAWRSRNDRLLVALFPSR